MEKVLQLLNFHEISEIPRHFFCLHKNQRQVSLLAKDAKTCKNFLRLQLKDDFNHIFCKFDWFSCDLLNEGLGSLCLVKLPDGRFVSRS